MISAVGIAVGTAALIIVLSVYNGFGRVVEQMYHQVDADLRIEAKQGKTFLYQPQSEAKWQQLASDPRVKAICPILEEHVFVTYDGRQSVAVAKGVDSLYEAITPLVGQLVEGDFELHHGEIPQVVVGRGIARDLGIMIRFLDPLEVYYPDPERAISLMNPAASLRSESFFVVGKVALEQQFDQTYFFAPIDRIRHLTARSEHAVSYLEVHLTPQTPVEDFQKTYSQILGEDFRLLDRYQQNETIYKMMTYEKVAIFLIFFFILLIVACNVFGSLSMLILEKKADIQTFRAMGTRESLLRRIFLYEGMLITGLGAAVGMVLGLLLCWLQQTFGWIQMPGNFIVQAYPIEVHFQDVLWVFTGIFLISSLLSALPAYNRHLFLLALLLLPVGCRSTSPARALAQVESYIHSDPERALAVLDSMDRQELTSRRDRAHYALLKSMALDKNYIDLTSDSVIAPAVAYYSKHGTADQKMKAYFYQGRIHQNAYDYDQALLSYADAQEWMDGSEDYYQMGIIYSSQAFLYGKIYNYDLQKEYIDLAKKAYARANDSARIARCQVDEAIYYQSILDWERADSVYQCLRWTELDSRLKLIVDRNYARMLLLQPEPDAKKARFILENSCGVLSETYVSASTGVYAYALVLLAEDDLAEKQILRYKSYINQQRGNNFDYWLYLIEKHRGNTSSALECLEYDYEQQTRKVRQVLSESLPNVVHNYKVRQHQIFEQRANRITALTIMLCVLLLIILIRSYSFYKRYQQEQQNKNLILQETLDDLLIENKEKQIVANRLQGSLKNILRQQLEFQKIINKYIDLTSGDTSGRNHLLQTWLAMQEDQKLFAELMTIVDNETSGAITLLRDQKILKEYEFYYLCSFLLGLDSSSIAVLMKTTTQYVYKVKRQIKLKLSSSEVETAKNLLNFL